MTNPETNDFGANRALALRAEPVSRPGAARIDHG